jgi:hypothetical protein
MGLILGTYVPPNRISVTLTLVITPLIFTGSSQYPWPSLGNLRWFQVLSALNPMTYVSEGLRGLMAPQVPHIQTWICFVVAVGSLVVLMAVGWRDSSGALSADRPAPGWGPRRLRCYAGDPQMLRMFRRWSADTVRGYLQLSSHRCGRWRKIVVVSPHFDDAALGAAHLLTTLSGEHGDHRARRAAAGLPDPK